jgi:hypothetical protein
LIPIHGMNRDQCSAESHVPCWGGIGPGSCHKPGPIPQNKPEPAPKQHEPGPMPVIGPDLPTKPEKMAFMSWTKDPFSTSGRSGVHAEHHRAEPVHRVHMRPNCTCASILFAGTDLHLYAELHLCVGDCRAVHQCACLQPGVH